MSAEHGHGHDAHESHEHDSHGPNFLAELWDGIKNFGKKVKDVLGLSKTTPGEYEKELVDLFIDDTPGAHNEAVQLLIELFESDDPEYIHLAGKFATQHKSFSKARNDLLKELEKVAKDTGGHGHDSHGDDHGHAHAA